MLRRGVYVIAEAHIEVLRDLSPASRLQASDFVIDGKPPVDGHPMVPSFLQALELWRKTMPDYNEIIRRIAAHLIAEYGVTPSEADGKAAAMLRDCDLSTVLVKGLAVQPLGESPRKTFTA